MGKEVLGGSSSRSGLGGKMYKPLAGVLPGLLEPGEARAKSLSGLMLDPARYQQVGDEYAKGASGFYLDPNNVPQLQELLRTFQEQSQRGLDQGLANLRSRFAMGGHTSTASSSPLIQAQEQSISDVSKSRDALAAQALFGLYGQERGMQQGSLGQLGQFEQTPAILTAMLAPLLNKSTASEGPGYLNALMKAVGSVASGVAMG